MLTYSYIGQRPQSLKQFFRSIGRFGITIILSVALLFIGGAGGFYLALFLQKVQGQKLPA
jgi:hypothetical protein